MRIRKKKLKLIKVPINEACEFDFIVNRDGFMSHTTPCLEL